MATTSTDAKTRAEQAAWTKLSKQLFASVFFGVASISIITVNKAVLTTFRYSRTYMYTTHPYNAHQLVHSSSKLLLLVYLLVIHRFPSFQVVGLGQVSCV